jgi:lysophospholipase L1-like esterase
VVLAIGTNNLTPTENARANTPAEIVEGIAAIREEIRKRSPESRFILMAVLPREHDAGHWLRKPIAEVNRLLAQRFASDASVTLVDIGARFLKPDGSLPAELMPDGTHPSDAGYQFWADALIAAGVKP